MTRRAVSSSNIREVGHEGTTLEVQFHAKTCPRRNGDACACSGGDVWRYLDVSPEKHAAFVQAPSVGAHFAQHIKPRHKGERAT